MAITHSKSKCMALEWIGTPDLIDENSQYHCHGPWIAVPKISSKWTWYFNETFVTSFVENFAQKVLQSKQEQVFPLQQDFDKYSENFIHKEIEFRVSCAILLLSVNNNFMLKMQQDAHNQNPQTGFHPKFASASADAKMTDEIRAKFWLILLFSPIPLPPPHISGQSKVFLIWIQTSFRSCLLYQHTSSFASYQCDQMVKLFFKSWPFATMKISPIMSQICQSRLSILPNKK